MEIITVTGRSAAVLNPLPCHLAVMATSCKFSSRQIMKLSIWQPYVTNSEGTVGVLILVTQNVSSDCASMGPRMVTQYKQTVIQLNMMKL